MTTAGGTVTDYDLNVNAKPICADAGWSLNKTLAIQTWMFCAGG